MNQEHFTFHLQYKHSGRLDNRNIKNFLTPKIRKGVTPFIAWVPEGRGCVGPRPTLEMPATCENNLWYPGYPIQITLLKMRPHGEMPFAIVTPKLSGLIYPITRSL